MNQQILHYTIVIQAAEEGGYLAFAPSLPGCMTQGETLEEAQKNITDAIEGYLAVLKEDGEVIPVEIKHPITSSVSVKMPA